MKRNRKLSALVMLILLAAFVAPFVSAQGETPQAGRGGSLVLYLPLIRQDEPPGPPVYPPINKIVFASGYTSAAPYHDITVVNPDGGGRVILADGGTASFLYPVWSPDGTRIAFTVIAGEGDDTINNIYVMNADGSGIFNLVTVAGHHFHAAWSPYGDAIAFSSDMHDPGEFTPNDIYVISADGSGTPVNLTNTPTIHEQSPDWSPDGERVVYAARTGPDATDYEIFVMNADGTGQTNLTQSPTADYAPSWSPDGSRIAFYRNLGNVSAPNLQIFVMNADGGGQAQLTIAGAWNLHPDWSPDGSQIAFQASYGGYTDIYVMNADGSGLTNITNSQAQYASVTPDWR